MIKKIIFVPTVVQKFDGGVNMFCEKCGKELREGVKFCPGCGKVIGENPNNKKPEIAPQQENGKLIVYGYTEWYAVKPKVDILKNGIKIAEVNPSSMIEIPIEENCTIQFKCMFRTATLQAYAGKTMTVKLSFNRITGELLINAPEQTQNKNNSSVGIAPTISGSVTNFSGTTTEKNKTIAGLLGIFLGGLGVHKFYMGNMKMGIIYILFCWTYIPAVLGLVEGIIYLTETEEKFKSRFL